jgi:hypothetical protein
MLRPRYRLVLERQFDALVPLIMHSSRAMPLGVVYAALAELGGYTRSVALHELVAWFATYADYDDETALVVARTLRRLWLLGVVARTA